MTTREEIEAAVERWMQYRQRVDDARSPYYSGTFEQDERKSIMLAVDMRILADAYLAERQQRERDQQPPTREMFERLGATLDRFHVLTLKTIEWHAECHCPWLDTIQLNTIAKLRAACLLLGIETEGVL